MATIVINGKTVTYQTGSGFATWDGDQANVEWHMNWKNTCQDKKHRTLFHVTKATSKPKSTKIHYFFYTENLRGATTIVSAVCPSEFRGEPGETKKFDDVEKDVKTYIVNNYDALFALA